MNCTNIWVWGCKNAYKTDSMSEENDQIRPSNNVRISNEGREQQGVTEGVKMGREWERKKEKRMRKADIGR